MDEYQNNYMDSFKSVEREHVLSICFTSIESKKLKLIHTERTHWLHIDGAQEEKEERLQMGTGNDFLLWIPSLS